MYDDLKDPNERLRVVELYRSVFLKTRNGKLLLTHILGELGFMGSVNDLNEKELGRYDYAIRILDILGIAKMPNIFKFVNSAQRWPTEYPQEKEEEDE